jgi:hypothetical protein
MLVNIPDPLEDLKLNEPSIITDHIVRPDAEEILTMFQNSAVVLFHNDDSSTDEDDSSGNLLTDHVSTHADASLQDFDFNPAENSIADLWLTSSSVIQRGFADFKKMGLDLFIIQCLSLLSKKFLLENAETPRFKSSLSSVWKDIQRNRENNPDGFNSRFIQEMASRCVNEAKEEIQQLSRATKKSNISEGIKGSVYALALYEWINSCQSYPEEPVEVLMRYETTFGHYEKEISPRRRNFTLAMIKLKQLVREPKQGAALFACTLLEGPLDLTHCHCFSGGHKSEETKFRIATYQEIIQPKARKQRTAKVHP